MSTKEDMYTVEVWPSLRLWRMLGNNFHMTHMMYVAAEGENRVDDW